MTPSQIIDVLNKKRDASLESGEQIRPEDDLPEEVREALLEALENETKEIPAGKQGETHKVSFDEVIDQVTTAYADVLMNILKEKYKKSIGKVKKDAMPIMDSNPNFKLILEEEPDWEEARIGLNRLLFYERPTMLAKMVEVREREKWWEYVARTGLRPTWTNQTEKDIEKWCAEQIEVLFQQLKEEIDIKVKGWLTPGFIENIEERVRTESVEKEVKFYELFVAQVYGIVRDFFIEICVIACMIVFAGIVGSLVFPRTTKRVARVGGNTLAYLFDFKEGLTDVKLSLHGYVVKQIKREEKKA